MKHLIAVFSLAALSVPAAAGTANPFDPEGPGDARPVLKRVGVDYPFGGTPSYNDPDADLALQTSDERPAPLLVAPGGNTRSDVELSASSGAATDYSPWAQDHNFIAPPQ